MEVKVRGVDAKYIIEIDRKAAELSKKLGRNFSRNEYLQMLIQRDSVSRLEDIEQDKFDRALENLISVLERHTASLQKYIDTNNKLFLAVLEQSDVDLSEVVEELDD